MALSQKPREKSFPQTEICEKGPTGSGESQKEKPTLSVAQPVLQTEPYLISDPALLAQNVARAMDMMGGLFAFYSDMRDKKNLFLDLFSPQMPLETVLGTFGEVFQSYLSQPQNLLEAQLKLWASHAQLWENAWKTFLGEDVKPIVTQEPGDKRFLDKDWDEKQVFSLLKQSYLITAQWAKELVAGAHIKDPHIKHKARFYIEQIANAFSPSNFAFTNPEILKLTLSCNGENLVKGLGHLIEDLMEGNGELKISQTDKKAFKVGKNLANTPGKVVFRNDLVELLYYAPTTESVHAIPLLIVPPWINKFYILDLNPEKSFIRWCVAQGISVFVVSWVNPDERHAQKTFFDYMSEGILEVVSAIETITGAKKVNAVGYCVGGTLLATTLGYMAKKKDDRIASATFLATQIDFSEAGDMLVFIDEEQIRDIEEHMEEKGYLEAERMAQAFNLLRSNDLIWSYVVNNYLKGRSPLPFDLLYWNSDSTRMPARTHAFYLRECYLKNALARGRLVVGGVEIDLKAVNLPVYNLATRDDHIAPLVSVYKLKQFFNKNTRQVVAGSGHIAGVINPPQAHKYSYWTNLDDYPAVEDWLKSAEEHPGSWWEDWICWLKPLSGALVAPPSLDKKGVHVLAEAPGTYVRAQSEV